MLRPIVCIGPVTPRGAEICVEWYLTRPNADMIRAGRLPRLYDSGVRYRREPIGHERWQTAAELLRRGFGDCEDLSAYLAAELRVYDGVRARVVIRRNASGGYHAMVDANGRILDPSKQLGM